MDGLSVFTALLLLVFALLQIILFFKLWGMTNNVKNIWNQLSRQQSIENLESYDLSKYVHSVVKMAKRDIAMGATDEAKKELLGLIYDMDNHPLKENAFHKSLFSDIKRQSKELLQTIES